MQGLWGNSALTLGLCRKPRAQALEAFPNILPDEARTGHGVQTEEWEAGTRRAREPGAELAPTTGT